MTENERLKIIMNQLGMKTQAQFSRVLGLTPGGLSDILRGKKGVGVSDKIKRILEHSYNINIGWLESGEGEMIKPTRSPHLEAVPLHLADPHGLEATGEKFYDLPDGTTVMQISVVPQKAWGSYQRGYGDPEFYDEFETIPVPVKKQHRGTYLAFEMKGRSMVNIETEEMARKSLWPGQKIIGRNLKREQWQYKLHIHSNEAWVIVHRVDGIMVKEIVNHDIDTGLLTLHSWNPDKQEFPDRVIHIDEVDQLFNVVDPFGKMRPY